MTLAVLPITPIVIITVRLPLRDQLSLREALHSGRSGFSREAAALAGSNLHTCAARGLTRLLYRGISSGAAPRATQ